MSWALWAWGGLCAAGAGTIGLAAKAASDETVRAWEEERADKTVEFQRKEAEAQQRREDARSQQEWNAHRDQEKLREKLLLDVERQNAENAVRGRRYRHLVDCKVVLTLQNPEAELVGVVTGVGRRGLRLRWIVDERLHGFTWEHIKKITLVPSLAEAAPEEEFDPDAI